jgi:hypothetical protein
LKGFFLGGMIQTEDYARQIGNIPQLSEEILEDGKICRISVFRGKGGDNQDRLFPLGVEPELGLQMLSVLPENVKSRYLTAVLREVGNG